MVFVPAIYFLSLFLYIYRKRGFDISACIISVYLFTAICSIFLYYDHPLFHRFGVYVDELSLVPTVVYCAMITLVTLPFYLFNSNKKRELLPIDNRLFNIMSWMFIICFLFNLILFKDDLIFRLSAGDDLQYMRGAEMETAQDSLTGPLKVISTITVAICSMSSVCFILFFYSITHLHKSKWFNALLLISSLGCIIQGIMGIDRSIAFYWTINFIFNFFLFKTYFNRKTKRAVTLLGAILLTGIFVYIIILSSARFGNKVGESFIVYMGQNYLNFCWFWDNYNAPEFNIGIFLPILSHFFIDWGYPVSAVPYGLYVQSRVGFFVNVFYTFMGSIMLYLGQWAVIPFCIIYTLIAFRVLLHKKVFNVTSFIFLFILAIIPYDGVILYILMDYIKAFGILVILTFCYIINRKQKQQLFPKLRPTRA